MRERTASIPSPRDLKVLFSVLFAALFTLSLTGCAMGSGVQKKATSITEPRADLLGQQITAEGWAVERKNGSALECDGFTLWLEDGVSWPDGFYEGGDQGLRVRVIGVLSEDHHLPVFIPSGDDPIVQGMPLTPVDPLGEALPLPTEGEGNPDEHLPVQGMPVAPGTDLHEAAHRWVIRDATWEVVTP